MALVQTKAVEIGAGLARIMRRRRCARRATCWRPHVLPGLPARCSCLGAAFFCSAPSAGSRLERAACPFSPSLLRTDRHLPRTACPRRAPPRPAWPLRRPPRAACWPPRWPRCVRCPRRSAPPTPTPGCGARSYRMTSSACWPAGAAGPRMGGARAASGRCARCLQPWMRRRRGWR